LINMFDGTVFHTIFSADEYGLPTDRAKATARAAAKGSATTRHSFGLALFVKRVTMQKHCAKIF